MNEMVRSKHRIEVVELHSSIRDIRLQDSGAVEKQMDRSIREISTLNKVHHMDSNKGVMMVSMAVPVSKRASATASIMATVIPLRGRPAPRK